ncbi:MAG: zinc-ribbon domain-containing protein [Candidatus Lokiarchaeota archaeon]|nr:zinc-ribbon domain-containing protein [Candidatus Lokiarchaeota archaeon]
MARRPGFLTVSYSGSGLETMDHEKRMVREKDVKFDGEDGSMEVTDVRLVWYKKPSRWGGVKKFGALAGAIAGAAILDGVGREVGGIGGRAIRGVGRGIGYAAVGTAISSWTRDSFYNKDSDGNTESIAVPLMAISTAEQSGKKLVVDLKAGGNMIFEFKQKKVIPSFKANILQAQQMGKCPYCGAKAGNASSCPQCGAPIEGGGGSGGGGSGGGAFCTNCGKSVPADAKFCGGCGQKV